jgi:hypothetical protein
VDSDEDREVCLENVLAIKPKSASNARTATGGGDWTEF